MHDKLIFTNMGTILLTFTQLWVQNVYTLNLDIFWQISGSCSSKFSTLKISNTRFIVFIKYNIVSDLIMKINQIMTVSLIIAAIFHLNVVGGTVLLKILKWDERKPFCGSKITDMMMQVCRNNFYGKFLDYNFPLNI